MCYLWGINEEQCKWIFTMVQITANACFDIKKKKFYGRHEQINECEQLRSERAK